jgi:predicted nucleotidyltransferase
MERWQVAGLTERENQAVNDLVQRLRRRLGDRLVEIRLYGSKARRTDGPESDIDLLAVVQHHTVGVRHEVFAEVSSVILEHDVLLDVNILDAVELKRLQVLGTPYAAHIQEEGITL